MAVWDDIITEKDKKAYAKYRDHPLGGFGIRPALIIVDMTYGFVDDRFSTGCSETGIPCVNTIRILLEKAREIQIPVIFTRGGRAASRAQAGLWKSGIVKESSDGGNKTAAAVPDNLPDPNDVVEELKPAPGEPVLEKHRPSAFFGTLLPSILTYAGVDTVLVTGMSTSGCVRATVVDAFSYNYRVIVPLEAVADRSETAHKANLYDIHMKYGDVLEMDKVSEYLSTLKKA